MNEEKKRLIKGNVQQRDKKMREMRSEFAKLDSFEKWSKEYQKFFNTQIDFLRKKCANIDT